MLRKFSNSVRRKGSGVSAACKFRFDFHIDYVDGLPRKVRHCRAQLKRSPKTNISELHPASGGRCDMGETLSFVATMYRTSEGTFESKLYSFVLQVPAKPEKPSTDKLLVLGDCVLDLARFAPNVDVSGQRLALPVPTKLKRVAQVHGTVTVTIVQAKMALDGLTNISGTEALSSTALPMDQDLSGFSDYDGEGATPKAGRDRTGGLSGSSSRNLRPPLASQTSPDQGNRGSSKTLARMGSASKGARNSLGMSGRSDKSDRSSQGGGSNTPLTPNTTLPPTAADQQRSGSSIPSSKKSPATRQGASMGRRLGSGNELSNQTSGDVDMYASGHRTASDHGASIASANGSAVSPPSLRSNRKGPSAGQKLPEIVTATHEEEEADGVRTPTRSEIAGRHIFDESKSMPLSDHEHVQDDSSLSEMSMEDHSMDRGAAQVGHDSLGSPDHGKSRNASARVPNSKSTSVAPEGASGKLGGLLGKLGGDATRADSEGSKIGAEMSAFSETITANRHLQRVQGQLQPMKGVQEATIDMGGETSAMENTGALSRVDTDDLLDGTVEGALANSSAVEQGPKKLSWRRSPLPAGTSASLRSDMQSGAHSGVSGADEAVPKESRAQLANSVLGMGVMNGRQGVIGGVMEGSPPESEASTLGGSSFVGGAVVRKATGAAGGVPDSDLLDDDLALPQTQGRDTQGNLVQDPMVSLAPDGIVSTMGGGLSGLGGASAMHGTLNLAPPHLMPKSTGNAAEGTSQVNNDRAIVPSQLSKAGGAVSPEDPSLLAKPLVGSPQTQERVTQLEKELQIERESSQAAIVALKQQLDVEKESSKTAIAQVQGELEQERAKSKALLGRARKDLESERDTVNTALKEVRADLDYERERAKTLSTTLEATAERSRTLTLQLEAANKQVTELKVMRRELDGSRREIEALRKSSADGGAAQKELSSVRRELESTKKQAEAARADYAEILKQNEKLKKDEDSLTEANQELERLRQDLQEARDSAADAQKRHQEEKQVVLDRMSTVTNGKDKEREQLQVQLQQQLQTSEEHVQELKSRLEKQEMATRDLKAENKSLSKSATESKGMKDELAKVTDERNKAVEEVSKLDEALAAVQNGPNVELMQAWDTERRELLQDLEAAENRVLGMQSQVAEGDMELHKLRKASEQLKREKEALQNDALQLTERTMELEHANRMLTNEVNEKKAGRAKSMRDSWSLDGGGLPTSPAPNVPIPGEDGKPKKKTKVVDVADYEKVVAELAELKLEFALGQERETIMRHEVQKARERKAQLEAKLTKVENSMYGGLALRSGAGGIASTDDL